MCPARSLEVFLVMQDGDNEDVSWVGAARMSVTMVVTVTVR